MSLSNQLWELLYDVFEGEPGCGCRELRLSQADAASLRESCPTLTLIPLEVPGEGKGWYRLSFPSL